MATGDLEGNVERVRSQLRSIGFPHPLDVQGLREGIPATVLPLLHYTLLGYSRHVARFLASSGYELYAKSDLRFMECLLKFLRAEFGYRCPLTLAQIFSRGFSERKLIFLHDVIQACKRKHGELSKTVRLENLMRKAKVEPSMLEGYMFAKENICKHFKDTLELPHEGNGGAFPNASATNPDVLTSEMTPKNTFFVHQDDLGTQGGNGSGSSKPKNDREETGGDCNDRMPFSNRLQSHLNADNISAQVFEEKRSSTGNIHKGDEAGDGLESLQRGSFYQCYIEIKQKIVNIAESIEARFSALEQNVARTTENLEQKIEVVEERIHNLEQTLTCQNTVERAPEGLTIPLMDHRQQDNGPSKTYGAMCFNDSVVKDHSEGFQNLSFEPTFLMGDFQRSLGGDFLDPEILRTTDSPFKYQNFLSTQELIANVKARCNKTMELLHQDRRRPHFRF